MEASDIKNILKDYKKLLQEAENTTVFGLPVTELDRDTILVMWMWSLKSAKEAAALDIKSAELNGELRGLAAAIDFK